MGHTRGVVRGVVTFRNYWSSDHFELSVHGRVFDRGQESVLFRFLVFAVCVFCLTGYCFYRRCAEMCR